MTSIHLEIVTPDGLIFSGDVKSVVLPGKEGEFGVLPGHASLVSLLNIGVVDIEKMDGKHEVVAIDWGYAEVSESKVDIIVDSAVLVSGNDDSQIAQSLEKAKAIVGKMGYDDALLRATMTRLESGSQR